MRHTFDRHTLDGAAVRAALLDLIVQLGLLLRGRGQAARALTLCLRFAGGTSWERTRRLAKPSAHEDDLRQLAYQLMDAAGLQRGRLTGLVLRGEDLVDADQVAEQISLDGARESRWSPSRPPTGSEPSSATAPSARPPSSAAPPEPRQPAWRRGCCSTRPACCRHI
ncbi:hypothetical protein ACIQMZ_35600 [Streptomyces longwoodensis]|uniref:DinB/UmuC family translesion DNA polymerase n=1 Tax=Streptomyces longwoodensis TaxID=68231 RepID=UPI00382E0716